MMIVKTYTRVKCLSDKMKVGHFQCERLPFSRKVFSFTSVTSCLVVA